MGTTLDLIERRAWLKGYNEALDRVSLILAGNSLLDIALVREAGRQEQERQETAGVDLNRQSWEQRGR